ncbi:MAG: 6,7-dimethyl-8-ribityllumazine synthase [Acidobacteriota bacterium]
MREVAGMLDARGLRFGIVLARFNARVGEVLLAGSIDALRRHGASEDAIVVARVPGAWELPQALRWMRAPAARGRKQGEPDALIALGALIRGETPHFDHLAAAVTRSLDSLASESGLPVAYGLLTCDTLEQAMERAGGKAGNKGFEAAMTAIEMVHLRRELGEKG